MNRPINRRGVPAGAQGNTRVIAAGIGSTDNWGNRTHRDGKMESRHTNSLADLCRRCLSEVNDEQRRRAKFEQIELGDRFFELLEKSALVTDQAVLAEIKDTLAAANGRRPAALLNDFVDRRVLSRWQIKMLSRGRYKNFHVGHYRLSDHLGTGLSTAVYQAEHTLFGAERAVKCITPFRFDGPVPREWFRVATGGHPNVVEIFDLVSENGLHFIVREQVAGCTLYEIATRLHPVAFGGVAEIVRQVAISVASVHRAGQVLRSILPTDIMLDMQGKVTILSPCTSWAVYANGFEPPSFPGGPSVCRHFFRRRPIRSWSDASPDDDIFGIGCLIYFLLTAEGPPLVFRPGGARALLKILRPDAPAGLVDIAERAIAAGTSEPTMSAAEIVGGLSEIVNCVAREP